MIDLIIGEKGKGKTKYLLDDVNEAVEEASGSVVYLDKDSSHMHKLSTKARLINVTDYQITNKDEFVGFIYGIVSQDYDLQIMYIDSFLKLANVAVDECEDVIQKLAKLSEKRNIRICISISINEKNLNENLKKYIKISL